MKEVHLFILWEKSRDKEKEILEDIQRSFHVIGLYNMTWSQKYFAQNLSRFYGTNLPPNSYKEEHCGKGDFLLVIVEVENPKYERRQTSKGIQIVNVNMFDKKEQYREMTGGGHKVHGTNSEVETNHDLTLLLGKNIEDYVKSINREQEVKIENLKTDLIGAEGFSTVKEMFYILNNCINYAIIRNYETLPEEIYVNEHNDIDIICDSCENAAYLLNGQKVFQEENRVHYKVKVEEKFAFFDLRYVGDNYYYYKMETDILKNRVYHEKGFYTISREEYFYALAYHAILQKPQLAEDYQKRLISMNQTNEKVDTKEDLIKILNKWLMERGYMITKPIDVTVQFNLRNAKEFNSVLIGNDLEKNMKLEMENAMLTEENNQLKEELRKVMTSKSWKITKPIRDIMTKIKK